MHKIVHRPKFCSLETKIGQLERIMKKIFLEKIVLFFKVLEQFSLDCQK